MDNSIQHLRPGFAFPLFSSEKRILQSVTLFLFH